MKKSNTNIGIICLGVICCFTIVLYGISQFRIIKLSEQIEKLERATDNVYGCQYIDSEFEKIRDEIDMSEYNFQFGAASETFWSDVPVRQGVVEIEDGLRVPADIKVIAAYNLEYATTNFYILMNPTEPGYLVVENTTNGMAAILTVVQAS